MSAVLRPNWLHCILCIIIFYLTVLNLILNQFLYHFKTPCLLFLTSCFYCCEWLFHILLCKALWITNVYEMCYTNKLALPCLAYLSYILIYCSICCCFILSIFLSCSYCSFIFSIFYLFSMYWSFYHYCYFLLSYLVLYIILLFCLSFCHSSYYSIYYSIFSFILSIVLSMVRSFCHPVYH